MDDIGRAAVDEKDELFGGEDGPGDGHGVGLDQLEGHPVRVAVVEFNSSSRDEEHKLVLEYPVEPNNVGVARLEGEGTFDALLREYVDELDANFSPLDGQDSWMATGELDGRNGSPRRDSDLEVVLLDEAFDSHVGEAMMDAEHLKVALIEEGALHLVYGIEGDGDLAQFEVVGVGGHGEERTLLLADF